MAGVLDRLLTYARGEPLGEEQMKALRTEGEPGDPPGQARSARNAVRARPERIVLQREQLVVRLDVSTPGLQAGRAAPMGYQ